MRNLTRKRDTHNQTSPVSRGSGKVTYTSSGKKKQGQKQGIGPALKKRKQVQAKGRRWAGGETRLMPWLGKKRKGRGDSAMRRPTNKKENGACTILKLKEWPAETRKRIERKGAAKGEKKVEM